MSSFSCLSKALRHSETVIQYAVSRQTVVKQLSDNGSTRILVVLPLFLGKQTIFLKHDIKVTVTDV